MLGAEGIKIILPSKYSEVVVYEIIFPFFISVKDEFQHRQVADKAFEDKSRQALTRYNLGCDFTSAISFEKEYKRVILRLEC